MVFNYWSFNILLAQLKDSRYEKNDYISGAHLFESSLFYKNKLFLLKRKIISKTIRPVLKIEYFSAKFKYELENILRKYVSYTEEFLKKSRRIVLLT